MQKTCKIVCGALLGLSLAAALAGQSKPYGEATKPYGKKPITRGSDFFQTATSKPTGVDFSAHPIPADFFCPGSKPFTGKVELKGVPLVTRPASAAGQSDTVVERVTNGAWTSGAAKISVKVRALRLTSTKPLSIDCAGKATEWQVDVAVCGDQPVSHIVAKADEACGCGHFDGDLKLKTRVKFTRVDTKKVAGPIAQNVALKITAMPWCPAAAPNQLTVPSPIMVDTACAAKPVWVQVPGTSNFFPGFDCTNHTDDCWTKFASLTHCHAGPTPDHPHCINPVCGKQRG